MVNVHQDDKIHWVRLILVAVGFLVLSAILGYYLQTVLSRFQIPAGISDWLVYLIIFGITLVVNLSVIPLPVAVSLMIVAAGTWNPILVALFGSLGACLGESSAYLVGFFGSRIAIHKPVMGYTMIQGWIKRFGFWAIAFLSFQPILPFEIGGFIAGCCKMPFHSFFPALCIGKFPKYLILIFAAKGIIHLFNKSIWIFVGILGIIIIGISLFFIIRYKYNKTHNNNTQQAKNGKPPDTC